jgi:glutamate/tyrosine decarboxylase-like PLP-dependent enzyme
MAEEIAGAWALDVLGLPAGSGVGFTTGATMATLSGLASARHDLLQRAGWDVEQNGLQGAPKIEVVVSDDAHITIFNALRILGLGAGTVKKVKADAQGRMVAKELAKVLETCKGPTIVCAQAGNVNSGSFDPLDEIGTLTQQHEAWLHVDGAFGLWAAASPRFKHLLQGVEKADSWTVDCHKWLNVPYDSALAIVKNPGALFGSFASSASYLVQSTTLRDPHEWVPEFSRRARGVAVWAAMRSLGRSGLASLVDRCCDHATRFAELLSRDPRVQILNDVVLNQVTVRFSDSDQVTAEVIKRVQDDGTCWLGGSKWQGKGIMRISVSNWATTSDDVETSVAAILRALNA